MELLLPTLLAHVDSLTANVEDIELSMAKTLSALDRVNCHLERQEKTIDRICNDIARRAPTPPLIDSSTTAQATLDVVLPSLREEMQGLRTYLDGVVERIAFTDATELPASPRRDLRSVGTSTHNIPIPPIPERRFINAAVQTEVHGRTVKSSMLPPDEGSEAGSSGHLEGDIATGDQEGDLGLEIGPVDAGIECETSKSDIEPDGASDKGMVIDNSIAS